ARFDGAGARVGEVHLLSARVERERVAHPDAIAMQRDLALRRHAPQAPGVRRFVHLHGAHPESTPWVGLAVVQAVVRSIALEDCDRLDRARPHLRIESHQAVAKRDEEAATLAFGERSGELIELPALISFGLGPIGLHPARGDIDEVEAPIAIRPNRALAQLGYRDVDFL